MRYSLFLLGLLCTLGCGERVQPTIYSQPVATSRRQPTVRIPPRRLTIIYRGDNTYSRLSLEHDPTIREIECISPPSQPGTALPTFACMYAVPGDHDLTQPLTFTLENPGYADPNEPCRVRLSLLQVFYDLPTSTEESYEHGQCVIRVRLARSMNTVVMPPPSPTGNGMWGTRNGPPVDRLDQTLP